MKKNTQRLNVFFLLFLSIILLITPAGTNATPQQPTSMQPTALSELGTLPTITLTATYTDTPAKFVPPPATFSTNNVQTATFNVTYLGSWPQEAKNAFDYAVSIWASLLSSPVPITAGAGNYWANFSNAPRPNTWYPNALVDAIAGTNIDSTNADIVANFSSNFCCWYFGTDGNTPFDKWDFVSVVLHELGHGLGFAGSMTVSNGLGSWGANTGWPFIYDVFTENGSQQGLITAFPNNSSQLAQQLTSGNIFFDGPNANAANDDDMPPKLYAPSTWQQGSSYSHLDEDTYGMGTAHALMTPSIANGEANHNPGSITLGIFEDIGWSTNTNTNTAPTFSSIPTQLVLMNSNNNNLVDLYAYADDAESADSALTFSITNTPNVDAGVSLDNNRYISINPVNSWTGTTTVAVRVTDPKGLSADTTFSVIVASTLYYQYLPTITGD